MMIEIRNQFFHYDNLKVVAHSLEFWATKNRENTYSGKEKSDFENVCDVELHDMRTLLFLHVLPIPIDICGQSGKNYKLRDPHQTLDHVDSASC